MKPFPVKALNDVLIFDGGIREARRRCYSVFCLRVQLMGERISAILFNVGRNVVEWSELGAHVCVCVRAGTRLVYDRAFLLECRNSPLANSPPVGLPQIPGVTCTVSPSQMPKNGVNAVKHHGHAHAQHPHVHVPVTTASAPTHAAPQPKKPQPAGRLLFCQSPRCV